MVFPCRLLLVLVLVLQKGGYGIFQVQNDINGAAVHTKARQTDESTQVFLLLLVNCCRQPVDYSLLLDRERERERERESVCVFAFVYWL